MKKTISTMESELLSSQQELSTLARAKNALEIEIRTMRDEHRMELQLEQQQRERELTRLEATPHTQCRTLLTPPPFRQDVLAKTQQQINTNPDSMKIHDLQRAQGQGAQREAQMMEELRIARQAAEDANGEMTVGMQRWVWSHSLSVFYGKEGVAVRHQGLALTETPCLFGVFSRRSYKQDLGAARRDSKDEQHACG